MYNVQFNANQNSVYNFRLHNKKFTLCLIEMFFKKNVKCKNPFSCLVLFSIFLTNVYQFVFLSSSD